MSTPETIESKIEYLLPGGAKRNRAPWWPPDVFCLCAAILQNCGAYSRILEDGGGTRSAAASAKRAQKLRRIGRSWTKAVGPKGPPKEVSDLWTKVFSSRTTPLNKLGDGTARDCRNALLDLLAIADETCVELGIYKMDPHLRHQGGLGNFKFLAETVFVNSMSGPEGATLCREIHPSRARVLPKMHTPQSGLTIRSLSHHLGYCPGSDMHPNWYSLASRKSSHSLNLLLVPWPMVVEPSQFQATRKRKVSDEVQDGGYGLFTFRPDCGPTLDHVGALLAEAERKVGPIDGIVFPELAMSDEEFRSIAAKFATPNRFVISGVGEPGAAAAGTRPCWRLSMTNSPIRMETSFTSGFLRKSITGGSSIRRR